MSSSSRLLDHYTDNDTRPLFIITDVEPDDLIALWLLFSHYTPSQEVTIVISAWREQQPRASFLDIFLRKYFPGLVFEIYLGEASSAKYVFPERMRENNLASYRNWKEAAIPPNGFYLQLAPVRELSQIFGNTPSIFADASLAIYGSFNVRSVSCDDRLLESFSKVFFYEAYPACCPTTISGIPRLTEAVPEIGAHVRWWNGIMLEYCGAEKRKDNPNNIAIVASITASPEQFVNADTGLIASLLIEREKIPHLVAVTLQLPKKGQPYTVVKVKKDSTITTIWTEDQEIKEKYQKILAHFITA